MKGEAMKSVDQRLSAIEAVVRRNQPEKIYVKLIGGETVIADAASVWDFFKNEELRKQVDAIWTETSGYEELCGLVENLCR